MYIYRGINRLSTHLCIRREFEEVPVVPHPYVHSHESKPNMEPCKLYLEPDDKVSLSVIRKRCHSKAYHDEVKRLTLLGKPLVMSQRRARDVASTVINKWEKAMIK